MRLSFPRSYARDVLRSCERGEREYSRTADTSARPPAVCTYRFGSTVEVDVRELEVGDGGLGWRVWVGALALAEWLAAHPTPLEGASVLELGSGLGLPGLVAAQLGAREVALTDCLPALVANCAHNAELNKERHAPATRVRALAMNWQAAAKHTDVGACPNMAGRRTTEDVIAARSSFDPSTHWLGPADLFDVVLASEVLYENEHAPTLAAAIATHLQRSEGARAFVMYVTRDSSFLCPDGILFAFVRAAAARGLSVRIIAGRQRGLAPCHVEFGSPLTAEEAERIRREAVDATKRLCDSSSDTDGCVVKVSMLTLRWA